MLGPNEDCPICAYGKQGICWLSYGTCWIQPHVGDSISNELELKTPLLDWEELTPLDESYMYKADKFWVKVFKTISFSLSAPNKSARNSFIEIVDYLARIIVLMVAYSLGSLAKAAIITSLPKMYSLAAVN